MLYLLTKSGGEYEDQWTTNVKLYKSPVVAQSAADKGNFERINGEKQLKDWANRREEELGAYPYHKPIEFAKEWLRKAKEYARENPRPEYEEVYWGVAEIEEPDE